MAPVVAILGSAIGGAIFGNAAAGWVVGSILGNILFPTGGNDQEGPRLDDLSVTSAAYGVAIPKNFGTVKHAGNVIWALPVREEKKEEKSGGKGGGSKVTSYTYFATLAIGISQGVANSLIKIWANEKLIFDNGVAETKIIVDPNDSLLDEVLTVVDAHTLNKLPDLDFNFYIGSETQDVDPLIQADKGTEAVPYRGLCYIVIDDLPLEDYGNAIPSFKFEVNYELVGTFDSGMTLVPQNGTPTVEPHASSNAVDWIRRKAYGADGGTVIGIDLDTMNEIGNGSPNVNGILSETLAVGRLDGGIYVYTGSGNSGPIVRLDPVTMQVTNLFGFPSSGLSNGTTNFTKSIGFYTIVVRGPQGDIEFLISVGQSGRGFGILKLPNLSYVAHSNNYSLTYITRGESRFGNCDVYFTDGTSISRIKLDYTARYSSLLTVSYGVDVDLAPRITFSDRTVGNLYWDESDNTLLIEYILTATNIVGYMKIEVDTWTTIWDAGTIHPSGNLTSISSANSSFYDGDVGVFGIGTSNATFIKLDTGEVVRSSPVTVLAGHGQSLAFNIYTLEGVKNGGVNGIGRINYFTTTTSQDKNTVASIVTYLCNKVGIPSNDINVSELTDIVSGYTLSRVAPARTWLDMLARIYFFEGMESDYILNFPKKAKSPGITIPTKDLISVSGKDNSAFSINTIQEPELPRVVEMNYIDKLTSYEPGTSRSQRIVAPQPAVFSNNKINFGAQVVLEPIQARRITEIILFNSWLERNNYQWKLSYKYLELDATDVVTIVSNIGTFTARIIKVDFSGDLIVSLAGISHEEANYSSIVDSQGGDNLPQIIPGRNFTKLTMLSIPLLLPSDDNYGTGLRMYYIMTGIGQPGWGGGVLFRSPSSSDFNVNPTDQSTVEAVTGTTVSTLGDFAFPNTVDTINSVNFVILTGSTTVFSSRTILEMLNDKVTALLVGKEIIRFATVIFEANGSITVSDLIRGQRNTEGYMSSHSAGEAVTVLDKGAIRSFIESVNDLGSDFFYKGVGFSEVLSTTETITQKSNGEAEKPYSVVQLKEVIVLGDSVITWERRSRIDESALLNGKSINIIGEVNEQYELEVTDTKTQGVLLTIVLDNIRTYLLTKNSKELFKVTGSEVNVPGTNLDCEALTGWTVSTGVLALGTSNPDPKEGISFFFGSTAANVLASQDLVVPVLEEALIDSGLARAVLKWWQSSFAVVNKATMRIEFYNASLEKLGDTFTLGLEATSPAQVWEQRILISSIPTLTRTIRIYVEMEYVSGGANNSNIDSITLGIQQLGASDATLKVYQMSEQVGRGRQLEQIDLNLVEASTGDALFSEVQLLMSFDGVNASTAFVDEGPFTRVLTSEAQAQLDTSQSKFGLSSGFFDGALDTVDMLDSEGFSLDDKDFTIETFVRFSSVAALSVFASHYSNSGSQRSWFFRFNSTNDLEFVWSTDGSNSITASESWTPSINTWYHVAVTRVGPDIRLFVDGIQLGTETDIGTSVLHNSTSTPRIAAVDSSGITQVLNGWLDEMRWTVGTGRYISGFTPPDKPFPRNSI